MARFLRRSRGPSLIAVRPGPPSPSRLSIRRLSPSPSRLSLSAAGSLIEHQVQRRYQYGIQRNWKEVMASFVVIACFVMTIIFVTGFNKTVAGPSKQYKADPQRGPYGLPPRQTPPVQPPRNGSQHAAGRAAVETPPKSYPTTLPPGTTEPDVSLEPTETGEGTEGNAYSAPQVLAAAKGAASTHCVTPTCHTLKKWFVKMVGDQADPCQRRNTFVCDASTAFPRFDGKPTKVLASYRRNADSTYPTRKAHLDGAGMEDLTRLCMQYARDPTAGAEDILSFLSHFKLDLRRMEHDPEEDPLARMMELSLEYGVHGPVSFTRKYDVTGEAPEPFILQIQLNPEVDQFLWALESMEPESVKHFYQLCLSHYGLVNDSIMTEVLLDADDQIGDILNETTDLGHLKKMTIAQLSNYTQVQTGRWVELLGAYGRFEADLRTEVVADEGALSMVAYLSRPGSERLEMRQVLAWHVLRSLAAPKVDLLQALNQTRSDYGDDDELFMRSPEAQCEGMVRKVVGVPFMALDLLQGNNAVPLDVITAVASLMENFRNALSSVVSHDARNGSGSRARHSTAVHPTKKAARRSTKVALFPKSAGPDADLGKLFAALRGAKAIGEERSFPLVWLRHLRAWHALPLVMQALLPSMAAVVNVESLEAFFRPPFYAGKAFPAYNFAALGQTVALALAHELVERRRKDVVVGSERWQRFWGGPDSADYNSTYCLTASFSKNDAWREMKLGESEFADGARLDHVLGTRIALQAFLTNHGAENGDGKGRAAELPGVRMANKQLFYIMHCALSCAISGGYDALRAPHHHACMVVYRTAGRFMDRPCGKPPRVNVLNECRYI